MSRNDFFHALALFFVLEGVFPFAFPRLWLENLSRLSALPVEKIRVFGFSMMFIGIVLSFVAHQV